MYTRRPTEDQKARPPKTWIQSEQYQDGTGTGGPAEPTLGATVLLPSGQVRLERAAKAGRGTACPCYPDTGHWVRLLAGACSH